MSDHDLRDRLHAGADPLRVHPDDALAAFHRSRPRRDRIRRAATIATALGLTALAFALTWLVAPFGDRDGTPATPTGATAAATPSGTIGYTLVVDGGARTELRTATLPGGETSPLVEGPFVYGPVSSPDGTMIAYGSGTEDLDHLELTVANADGSDARGLGVEIRVSSSLSWSPDGASIAYIRSDEGPDAYDTVAIIGVDGSGGRAVLPGLEWQSVSWSPDGERLLVVGHPPIEDGIGGPTGWDIYSARTDGTDLTQLTATERWEHLATWSPDGSSILFTRSTDSSDDADYRSDVWTMARDGSHERQLTDWRGFDAWPVWSPDGRWVAFASDRDATPAQQVAFEDGQAFGGISLFVMRSDGSGTQRVVTAGEAEALLPGSWVPG